MATAQINKKVLKNGLSELKTDYTNLITHLDEYVKDIKDLNENTWHGGKRANKTYTAATNYYKNSVKVVTKLSGVLVVLNEWYEFIEAVSAQ